jgi:hypothetical protein
MSTKSPYNAAIPAIRPVPCWVPTTPRFPTSSQQTSYLHKKQVLCSLFKTSTVYLANAQRDTHQNNHAQQRDYLDGLDSCQIRMYSFESRVLPSEKSMTVSFCGRKKERGEN